MEADRDSGVHGVNDVFANERLVLEPMRAATDLVHGVGHDAFQRGGLRRGVPTANEAMRLPPRPATPPC